MILRRFFWLFDFVILIAIFWVSYGFTSIIVHFITPDALLWIPWVEDFYTPFASGDSLLPWVDFVNLKIHL
jgi:hypothetical protein